MSESIHNKDHIKATIIIAFIAIMIISGVVVIVWYSENVSQSFFTKFTVDRPDDAEFYRVTRTLNDSISYPKEIRSIRPVPESKTIRVYSWAYFEGRGAHYWNVDIDVEFYKKDPFDGGYID